MPLTHRLSSPRTLDPRAAETRARILETSLRLFAEHGFKGVSVRDISAAAAVNVAAVSYHFGSKQGLYRTIFETVLDEDEGRFSAQMTEVESLLGQAGSDPARLRMALEGLAGGLVERIASFPDFRWFSVLLARELAFPGELFELIYQRRAEPVLRLLARAVGLAQGLPADSAAARFTANLLYGQIGHLVFSRPILWRQVGWDQYTPERVDLLRRTVADLIGRALGLPALDHPYPDTSVLS
jgi:TetR/AcrR family transcriptional regulator, regulator of cefoperazone and chloramphenicol sensitivity